MRAVAVACCVAAPAASLCGKKAFVSRTPLSGPRQGCEGHLSSCMSEHLEARLSFHLSKCFTFSL